MDSNYFPASVLNKKVCDYYALPGFCNCDIFQIFVDYGLIEEEAGRGDFTVGWPRL